MAHLIYRNQYRFFEELNLKFYEKYAREWMTFVLILTDCLSLLFALSLVVISHHFFIESQLTLQNYLRWYPLIVVFITGYAIANLYPASGINPVDEIRKITYTSTVSFFLLIVFTFWFQNTVYFSRFVLTGFWVTSFVVVPTMRFFVRWLFIRAKLWGLPVAVIGSGDQTRNLIEYLLKNQQIGLRPVVLVNGFYTGDFASKDICILESEELLARPHLLASRFINTVIIVPGETPRSFQTCIVNSKSFGLKRLVMISSLGWVGGSAIVPHDFQGVLGFEIEQKLLNKGEQNLKRLVDLAVVILGGLFFLPLISLIGLAIRIESPGSVFYSQKRKGKQGNSIKVWKFRSMVTDADELLKQYLADNPDYLEEWEQNHKLKNDPRITKIGKLLRATSLDELPQLWNVLKGEMSLVGPRPIVEDEVRHYKDKFDLYIQVPPGMTGLWQVSGRSDTSYETRVRLDEYYIRHWSIWMDIYVIIRTLWVVIKRSGAY